MSYGALCVANILKVADEHTAIACKASGIDEVCPGVLVSHVIFHDERRDTVTLVPLGCTGRRTTLPGKGIQEKLHLNEAHQQWSITNAIYVRVNRL